MKAPKERAPDQWAPHIDDPDEPNLMTPEESKAMADGIGNLPGMEEFRKPPAQGDVTSPIRLVPVDHDPFADGQVPNR